MTALEGGPEQRLTPLATRCVQPDLFSAAGGQPGASTLPGDPSPDPGETSPEVLAIADACCRTPQAIVCMLSAASLLRLLPDASARVWLGAPLRIYIPRTATPPRVLRWSNDKAFYVGVQTVMLHGVTVPHTGPARTVIDLVRYGRHVGGVEAATRCLRSYTSGGGTAAELQATASAVGMPRRAQEILDLLVLGVGLVQP